MKENVKKTKHKRKSGPWKKKFWWKIIKDELSKELSKEREKSDVLRVPCSLCFKSD